MNQRSEAKLDVQDDVRGTASGDQKKLNVTSIRTKLQMTVSEFAATFGFSIDQVLAWESGREYPSSGSALYLISIDREAAALETNPDQIRHCQGTD